MHYEGHGDENLIDLEGVRYDEQQLRDALELNIEKTLNSELADLADFTHGFDSSEWHREAAGLFTALLERSKRDAQEVAEQEHIDERFAA